MDRHIDRLKEAVLVPDNGDDVQLPAQPESADAPAPPHQHVMTISDLITMCNVEASKMSVHNDHRLLLMNCAYAMRQLVDRLDFHEQKAKVQ